MSQKIFESRVMTGESISPKMCSHSDVQGIPKIVSHVKMKITPEISALVKKNRYFYKPEICTNFLDLLRGK